MGYVNIQEPLLKKYTRIVSVIACYWVVSISLVFINKYLLSGHVVQLDAPLFITCFQCIVTVIVCSVLTYLAKIFPSVVSFPPIEISFEILRKILPLSVVFVAMMVFNNLCLQYVGVPFYYIGRSLTTVFNVVLTFLLLRQKTSGQALFFCFVIVLGFGLGVKEEDVAGSLSIRGVIYGVLASFFVSLYSVFIKKALSIVDGSIWLLTFYNNLNAIFLFLPLMLIFGEIHAVVLYGNVLNLNFWLLMVCGGIFGFAIGYVTGLQIKVTSPLTHNISGTAKACAQTVIAVIWFNESKSILWWTSNCIVLFGSAAYTKVRQMEMKKDHQERLKAIGRDIEAPDTVKS